MEATTITETVTYLGVPEFIWNNIFVALSTLICGFLVAYFTSTFLKRKEERTRIAGIIVEKRISCEQEIIRFLEKALFKEEMNRDNTILHDKKIVKALAEFGLSIPYSAPQYARLFLDRKDYEKFFHEFEEIISANKLWIDERVRRHLMLMQAYFSWINVIPLIVKRIPLPKGKNLTNDEFDAVCRQALLFYGIVLDNEINGLVAELDALVVDSVYRLDLNRPRKSLSRNGMWNSDTKNILRELKLRTILGSKQEKLFSIISSFVYDMKRINMDAMPDEEFDEILREYYPEDIPEAKKPSL